MIYEVIETVVYNIDAESEEEAEETFCTLEADELRERVMVFAERTIEAKR